MAALDLEYGYWTTYQGINASDLLWVPHRDKLLASEFNYGYIVELNTTDATDAGSVAITSSISSPWRSPQPGGRSVAFTGLQIMMTGGAETALIVTTYLNGDTTGTAASSRTPNQETVHEIAFDDQVGFQYRYTISGAACGTIIQIVEHWEAV
jgi:hypothetical protein